MILMPILLRQNQIVNINSVSNNINLFAQANSPAQPINVYCNITANISSDSTTTYAFQTGTGWKGGSYLYIKNSATISGLSNTTPGSNGVGGAGGHGGDSTTSFNGVAGSSGTAGTNGANGGPSFAANTVSGVKIALNNIGIIAGGSGGAGGAGGGGGGGGGSAYYG